MAQQINVKENSKLHNLLKAAQELAKKELQDMDKIQFIATWKIEDLHEFTYNLKSSI